MKYKYLFSVCVPALSFWALSLFLCSAADGQPMTHVVKKGDTLWDICEQYYGDPDLWPKLWEMNPFITNPHLLKPGDVITLLEGVPLKPKSRVAKKPSETVSKPEERAEEGKGIDVSSYTDVGAMGYLDLQKTQPWGHLVSSEKDRVTLAEGDRVFVRMTGNRTAKAGDEFTIYSAAALSGDPLKHPVKGDLLSFLGRLVVTRPVNKDIFEAQISESYQGIHLGDMILPYHPLMSCVEPTVPDEPLTSRIVAIKDLHEIIGEFTVVYIGKGSRDGVRAGNLFEIVKKKEIREGDKGVSLPDIPLGHLLVLDAKPTTATGIVIRSTEEVYSGAVVKSMDWDRATHLYSMLPKCPLE